jgi:hypothetical protein
MTVQSPPPPPTGPAAPKKGLSPLAWVGIGCGVILVLGFIVVSVGGYFAARKLKQVAENPAMAVAEAMVAANPDVELVKKDEDAKTITVRDKKTGEVMTVDLDDIKNGQIKFKDANGKEANLQMGQEGIKVTDEKGNTAFQAGAGQVKDLPSWVPVYPGGQTQGSFSSQTAEEKTANFSVTTSDSVDQVLAFYKEKLEANGLKIEQTSTGTNANGSGAMLSAKSADEKRTVVVMAGTGSDSKGTTATVTYVEKP